MYNEDGTKVKRISDIKTSIIIVLHQNELSRFQRIVSKKKAESQKKVNKQDRNKHENYKNIMKSAIHKWYNNNLEDWKYQSQQVLSGENINSYIKTYKTGRVPRHHHSVDQGTDNSFVYDNDEWKAITIHKYGAFEPPAAKGPIRMENTMDSWEKQALNVTDTSFFATQSNLENSLNKKNVKVVTKDLGRESKYKSPMKSSSKMGITSRRDTSLFTSKSILISNL